MKFKVGDVVRIENPQMFVRCGYPMIIEDAIKIIEENHLVDLHEFSEKLGLGLTKQHLGGTIELNKRTKRFMSALGYQYVGSHGHGGRTRSLHTVERPDLQGRDFKVIKKFGCWTGDYYGPSGGVYYDGEYWNEPGGLENRQYHSILTLAPLGEWYCEDDCYNIEQIHVTKVEVDGLAR